MKKLIFDIEADGLTPTKLWCIVAKELDGTTHTFNPVSYTHLTLPTKA